MAQRVKSWVVDKVAHNLRLPQKGVFGSIATIFFVKRNSFLETNAVSLCNIKPDYKVLEIGFGPGVGLEAAYDKVKDGDGKVYGIDTSLYMVETAGRRLKKAVKDGKVILFHGSASSIPLNTDTIHRVFHCNCYYFWPSMRETLREIYRVMRPGGVMVTTLNMSCLQVAQKRDFLKYGDPDPVKYMASLENFGFENVHIKYRKDTDTGTQFQVIYAEVREKPAHDDAMFSDDDNLDSEIFLKYQDHMSRQKDTPPVS